MSSAYLSELAQELGDAKFLWGSAERLQNRMTAGNAVKSIVSQSWLYDIWSKRNSLFGGCLAWLYLLDASSNPLFQLWHPNQSPDIAKYPFRCKIHPQLENPQLRTTNLKEPSPSLNPYRQIITFHPKGIRGLFCESMEPGKWSEPGNKKHRKREGEAPDWKLGVR